MHYIMKYTYKYVRSLKLTASQRPRISLNKLISAMQILSVFFHVDVLVDKRKKNC